MIQNKLPTMAFDSPRFITDDLSQTELWPIKIHEGRRSFISPEFAMKTNQNHTPLKQLVYVIFETSYETRGEQKTCPLGLVISGHISSPLFLLQNNPKMALKN